ncbi:hypothetical protein [Roseivirga pacifica]|uniref:hypothetical protein n=1 Tax=Roseivirga pacifica TaxID=1267423 RepID=UPI00227D61FC|nr:hypothetical protein [Roseivirga pacifica]
MVTASSLNRIRIGLFILIAGAILSVSWWLMNAAEFSANRSALAIGTSLDIAILIPLFYFLLIRKTEIPKITLLPVTVLSLIIAYQIIPAENHSTLGYVELALFPIEIGVIGYLIYSVRKIVKGMGAKGHSLRDFPEVLKCLLLEKNTKPLLTNVVSSEASLFYYTFAGWRKPKALAQNEFSSTKSSNYGLIFGFILFILPVETVVLHILLNSFSPILAWVLTGISIYSLFFIFGDRNALRHRPNSVETNGLKLKTGIRWSVFVPFDQVIRIEYREGDSSEEKFVNLSPFGAGNVVITMKDPIEVNGIYGLKKTTDKLVLSIDQLEELKAQLPNLTD